MGKNQLQFIPASSVQKGDTIQNQGDKSGGFHVVLQDHICGMTPPKPGESNDYYHYSLGPSSAGKM